MSKSPTTEDSIGVMMIVNFFVKFIQESKHLIRKVLKFECFIRNLPIEHILCWNPQIKKKLSNTTQKKKKIPLGLYLLFFIMFMSFLFCNFTDLFFHIKERSRNTIFIFKSRDSLKVSSVIQT